MLGSGRMRPARTSSRPVASSGVGKRLRARSSTTRRPGAAASSPRGGFVDRVGELDAQCLGVRPHDRDTQTGWCYLNRIVVEDLARLVNQLGLFEVVTVFDHRAVVAKDVERAGLMKDLGLERLTGQGCLRLGL